MLLVSSHPFTAVSQVDIPFPSGKNFLELRMRMKNSVDTADLRAKVTTDGFTTVKEGASDYTYNDGRSWSVGENNTGDAGDPHIQIGNNQGNAANEGIWGPIRVLSAANAARATHFVMDYAGGSASHRHIRRHGCGIHIALVVVNGVRFYMTSGTLSGLIEVFARPV